MNRKLNAVYCCSTSPFFREEFCRLALFSVTYRCVMLGDGVTFSIRWTDVYRYCPTVTNIFTFYSLPVT